MKHVVMFSGGIASWATAKRVAETHGIDDLTLLFTDTLTEDEDLYRFLDEAAADVGGTLVKLSDGRTIWQVFKDTRYLGNTRADPCSRILKRELSRQWLADNADPAETTVYLGFDWTEIHRFERSQKAWTPWHIESPLLDPPLLMRTELFAELAATGIEPPRLYGMGMSHNNCGGGCVKAGKGHFAQLLSVFPERFAEWEANEEDVRQHIGKDVSILRDEHKNAAATPLTLRGSASVSRQVRQSRCSISAAAPVLRTHQNN